MICWRWDDVASEWREESFLDGTPAWLAPRALVVRAASGRHVLLAKDDATVNGLPALPLVVLDERDEITVGGDVVYVGTAASATPVAFPGATGPVSCARCAGELRIGDAAVRCPRCRRWYHQGETLSCWAYDATCAAGCDQPTTGASWKPEPLRRRRGTATGATMGPGHVA